MSSMRALFYKDPNGKAYRKTDTVLSRVNVRANSPEVVGAHRIRIRGCYGSWMSIKYRSNDMRDLIREVCNDLGLALDHDMMDRNVPGWRSWP